MKSGKVVVAVKGKLGPGWRRATICLAGMNRLQRQLCYFLTKARVEVADVMATLLYVSL